MPKKYTPQLDDYMMFAAVSSMYQMFRPIEEKLRAAGYTGVLFSDYDSMLNNQGNENTPDTDYRADVFMQNRMDYQIPLLWQWMLVLRASNP